MLSMLTWFSRGKPNPNFTQVPLIQEQPQTQPQEIRMTNMDKIITIIMNAITLIKGLNDKVMSLQSELDTLKAKALADEALLVQHATELEALTPAPVGV